jgi:hypothetical protein
MRSLDQERLHAPRPTQVRLRQPPAEVLCDYPDSQSTEEGGTCSRPTCKVHARYWQKGKDVCQEHAKQLGCR